MSRSISSFTEWGRKVVCVGRNFRDHCAELNNPVPKEPMLFLKPTSSYVFENNPIVIPKTCSSLHHEVELGVVISKTGSNISKADAMNHIGGYVLALDMTARDWQSKAKEQGKPWSCAKGFDTACPLSKFIPIDAIPDPHNVQLWLNVNGVEKQNGTTSNMIFTIPVLVSYISQIMKLEEGDLILTGTPEGVGPVVNGDVINCGIKDVIEMSFPVQS